ncbi:MAG: DUF2059 domain-containing protein [Desulfobacterales bacterium]|nr:DUF2059 domain-containing protein [Desulfobacterales bacterium]MCP4160416.1 DUF2059 domain-containing protein [Deltaproteobacteria bacterium]
MKYRVLAVLLVFTFLNSAFAKQPNRDKLIELAKYTGMYEQINQQKIALNEQGQKLAQQYSQQLLASFKNISPELQKDLDTVFVKYMQNIGKLINEEKAINSYLDLISKKLDAKDIDTIVAFYKSPAGKKFTKANISITPEWTKQLMGNMDKKLMVELQQLLIELQTVTMKYKNK